MMTFQDVINGINQYAQTINLVLLISIIGILIQAFTAQRNAINEQKNAIKEQTETLDERINFLKDQLDAAKAELPLVFAERLKKRLELTEEQYTELEKELEEALRQAAQKDEAIQRLQETYSKTYQKIIQVTFDFTLEKAAEYCNETIKAMVDRKIITIHPENLIRWLPEMANQKKRSVIVGDLIKLPINERKSSEKASSKPE